MVPKDDCRRTWLDLIPKGTVFYHVARYVPPRPDWDHEHCELCFEKIGTGGLPGGYATADRYRWLCPECWRDFREECEWTLEGDDGDG